MNLSQLVDIVFKAFHGGEAKKKKQVMVFLETVPGKSEKKSVTRRKESRPLGSKQCTYCREGH